MKQICRFSHWFAVVLVAGLLFGTIFASSAQAAPPGQDPRPPVDRGGDGGGNGGGGGVGGVNGNGNGNGNGAVSPTERCASLVGQVINWGVGGMGGIGTELKTGSWEISAVSSTDGNYGFGGLGIGAATLHITIAPELADELQPLIQDAGVYLNCDFPIIANIALFDELPVEPPATIDMTASETTIAVGGEAEITLTVDNGLPTDISNVVVTAIIPPGLTPVDVSAEVGPEAVRIADADEAGQLVVINLSTVPSEATATIQITVVADAAIRRSELTSTATLFYRESVAHQASLAFDVDDFRGARPVLTQATATPESPELIGTPVAEAPDLPAPDTPETESSTTTPTEASLSVPAEEAEDGEEFVPPNGLPGTGGIAPVPDEETAARDESASPGDRTTPEDSFTPPPDLLPTTGRDVIQKADRFAYTGLNPLLPLGGLVLAGLVFAVHQLHETRRNNK